MSTAGRSDEVHNRPPMNLYHPVLPYGYNKKLLFCPCRTCAHEQNLNGECGHLTDDERALSGTWVIPEINLAVAKILEIHELYEYQVTQYNREQVRAAFSPSISIYT